MGKGNTHAWYVCMVVATTMILYGYDSSTFNAVQGSKNWVAYFHKPSPSVIGSINTAYNVGGIIAGKFVSMHGRRYTKLRQACLCPRPYQIPLAADGPSYLDA